MKKNQSLTIIAYIIAYTLYFILTVTLITPKTAAFWISYAFTVIAFILVFVIFYLSKGHTTGDLFYSIPLILLVNGYLLLQLVLGIVLALFSPKAKITFIIEIIPLALLGIVAISAQLERNIAETQEENANAKIAYLHELESVLHNCEAMTQDEELRIRIASLKEKVHYSDPISHDSLSDLESRMLELAKQICAEIRHNPEIAKQHFQLLETMLADRNEKCKLLK